MQRARIVLLAALVGLLALACIFAGYRLLFPAYTDLEIQASFVDTWEAEALFISAALAALATLVFLSALLAWGGSHLAKRLSLKATALSVSAATLLVASHIALTERTAKLTGQTFGGFYGLF